MALLQAVNLHHASMHAHAWFHVFALQEDGDESGPPSDADSARAESQNAEGLEDNPDDISDTGWDTDLEIEGIIVTQVYLYL